MGMTKNLQQFGTPWHKKAVRQPALLIRNSRTEPLWNTRTIGLAALATVAVIGLVSMSGISSPTRRRMPKEKLGPPAWLVLQNQDSPEAEEVNESELECE